MTKVAVVTGGTRGIGSAISKALHEAGHKVVANFAGNVEKAEEFKSETGIEVMQWDVSQMAACQEGLAKVEKDIGPVDILVNNAGITRDAMLHKMNEAQWQEVINTNLNALFYMCKCVIEGMRSRGFGRIVSISSINGQKGQLGQANYSAAKAGLIGFSKAVALENARKGITVNVVSPGYIDTEMVAAVPEKVLQSIIETIPVGRLGKAEEIASMVAWLSSDMAAFTTGAVITMNGGQYLANG